MTYELGTRSPEVTEYRVREPRRVPLEALGLRIGSGARQGLDDRLPRGVVEVREQDLSGGAVQQRRVLAFMTSSGGRQVLGLAVDAMDLAGGIDRGGRDAAPLVEVQLRSQVRPRCPQPQGFVSRDRELPRPGASSVGGPIRRNSRVQP